jgi:hypothetical protein
MVVAEVLALSQRAKGFICVYGADLFGEDTGVYLSLSLVYVGRGRCETDRGKLL